MQDFQTVKDKLLKSYSTYYNIKTEDPTAPFFAEASFKAHNEQFFLVKSAKLSEFDSKEFVFFAYVEDLNDKNLAELDEKAWTEGLGRAEIKENHRSTDVVLIILAERFAEGMQKSVRKMKHSKSYRFGLYGYSNYKLVAYELSSGMACSNRMGKDLKKLFGNA
jgi:hypothetical protein